MPLQTLAESLFPLSQKLFPAPPQLPPHALQAIRSTRKLAQWKAGISQAYAYLSGRTHDPQEQGWLDLHHEQIMQDKPDFARVRRTATFAAAPVIIYNQAAAAENETGAGDRAEQLRCPRRGQAWRQPWPSGPRLAGVVLLRDVAEGQARHVPQPCAHRHANADEQGYRCRRQQDA